MGGCEEGGDEKKRQCEKMRRVRLRKKLKLSSTAKANSMITNELKGPSSLAEATSSSAKVPNELSHAFWSS